VIHYEPTDSFETPCFSDERTFSQRQYPFHVSAPLAAKMRLRYIV